MHVSILIMAIDQSVQTILDLATQKPSNFLSYQTQLADVNQKTPENCEKRSFSAVIKKKVFVLKLSHNFKSQIKAKCFHLNNGFDVSVFHVS